ncbi:Gfo/Idh/MocA family oxidoreductase [Oxalobacteraceae bacterium OM1]|nr:Gfo/Idh/MocA family oxidoreductase [Oxalobacteraceae bacterium OM1]
MPAIGRGTVSDVQQSRPAAGEARLHSTNIGVGLICIGSVPRLVAQAHVSALHALEATTLTAIGCVHDRGAWGAASPLFGCKAHDTPERLIADPAVQLVVLASRSLHDGELARTALLQEKPVLCEWPVAPGTADVVMLERLAERIGVPAFVALTSRVDPVVNHARELIRAGHIGQLVSLNVHGTDTAEGKAAGAEAFGTPLAAMLRRAVAHTLDAALYAAGETVCDVHATASSAGDPPSPGSAAWPAGLQLAFNGRLQSGPILSALFRRTGGQRRKFRIEINGTKGDLVVFGSHGHPGAGISKLISGYEGARGSQELAVPESDESAFASPAAANTARLYQRIAHDLHGLHERGRTAPRLDEASRLHRILDAIESSAQTGISWRV